jgi:hypothetical protein
VSCAFAAEGIQVMTAVPTPRPHNEIVSLTSDTARHVGQRVADDRPMRIRWWLSALKAMRGLLSRASEGRKVGRYPLPDWLQRDLVLTEDDVKSQSDRISEMRQRHSEWR